MKSKVEARHKSNGKDLFWVFFTLAILVIITLYGYDILEYVSTHNILRGQF